MARHFARSYSVLPLGEAVRRLQDGTLPAAAATITFDDGYADNFQVAWPILQRYALPATFFIATAFLDGGRMWNDDIIETVRNMPDGYLNLDAFGLGTHNLCDTTSRIRCYESILGKLKYFEHFQRMDTARQIALQAGLPATSNLMMTRNELRSLQRRAEIGAHTHAHPILECLSDTQARAEMEQGKYELESILGSPVRVFAYPNGVPDARLLSAACGDGQDRFRGSGDDRTKTCQCRIQPTSELPRFTPSGRALRFLLHET